eukprot:m.106304 g.106304  ORF g.106304 m.106304 type:complete len:607 (-) comp21083_c0_seq1:119-1939(-)
MPLCGATTLRGTPCRNPGQEHYGWRCHHHEDSVCDEPETSYYSEDDEEATPCANYRSGAAHRSLFRVPSPVAQLQYDDSNAYDVEDGAEFRRLFAEANATQKGVVINLTSKSCPGARSMVPVVDGLSTEHSDVTFMILNSSDYWVEDLQLNDSGYVPHFVFCLGGHKAASFSTAEPSELTRKVRRFAEMCEAKRAAAAQALEVAERQEARREAEAAAAQERKVALEAANAAKKQQAKDAQEHSAKLKIQSDAAKAAELKTAASKAVAEQAMLDAAKHTAELEAMKAANAAKDQARIQEATAKDAKAHAATLKAELDAAKVAAAASEHQAEVDSAAKTPQEPTSLPADGAASSLGAPPPAASDTVARFMDYVHSENEPCSIVGLFHELNPEVSIDVAVGATGICLSGTLYTVKRWTKKAGKAVIAEVPGMTVDMAAAVRLYTAEAPAGSPLYKELNKLLRNSDREALKRRFFPFLRLLETGLRKLRATTNGVPRMVNRGVGLDLVGEHPEDYEADETMVWWAYSSTTSNIAVLSNPMFLGSSGNRTIFQIHTAAAVDVSAFSAVKSEAELLLSPGVALRITGILPKSADGLTIVTCEDDPDAPDLIA